MWNRKELKAESKANLKKNYWAIVAVCFIMALLAMEYSASTQAIEEYDTDKEYAGKVVNQLDGSGNSGMVNNIIQDNHLQEELHPQKGVFASLFNIVTKSKTTITNLGKTVNHIIQNNGALALCVSILGVLLSAFYEIFLKSLLRVGERRFFLENHLYHKTHIGRILFLFKERKFKRPVWTLVVMNVYQFLWNLTIIGGCIKHYSYKMIPYIMAENPDMTRKDAFYLSREMMKGNKWKTFVMDLTFWGWYILQFATVGLFGLFFLNPYRRGTEAGLYLALRETAIAQNMAGAEGLTDTHLVQMPENHNTGYYPGVAGLKGHHKLAVDYHRHYSIINLVLFFFTAAFIGWCWEVFLHLVRDGVFVNRGTMFGPWLPIYGVGGVVALILLKRFIDRPVLTFGLTMVICGIVEYFTAWFLEDTKGVKWWDYSGYMLNLNGRICLEGLLTFAIAGCAFMYLIAPRLDDLYNRIPIKIKLSICGMLVVLFGIDSAYSHFHPNTGAGITDYGMREAPVKSITCQAGDADCPMRMDD